MAVCFITRGEIEKKTLPPNQNQFGSQVAGRRAPVPQFKKKSNLETNERKKTFIYFIAKYCFDFLMLWSGGVGFLGSKTPKTIAPNELE